MELGFIGLGHMGFPIARRLIESGHRVVAYDTRDDALDRVAALGADRASSPKRVADHAETWPARYRRPGLPRQWWGPRRREGRSHFDAFRAAQRIRHRTNHRLYLDEAKALGVPVDVAETIGRVWDATAADQGPDSDFTTVIKPFEKAAGVTVGSQRPASP